MHKAEKNLKPSDPVRLSLALNFSIFQFNGLKDKAEAIKITNKAVEQGAIKMDQLTDEMDKNDSRTIIELLRENLITWEDVDPTMEHLDSLEDDEV